MKTFFASLILCICFLVSGFSSTLDDAAVNLTFVNYTFIDVEVYQVTPSNSEVFKSKITSGSYYDLRIPSGMQWRVKAANNKAVFMEGTAGSHGEDIDIEFRSQPSGSSAFITFSNNANGPVDIFWLDPSGNESKQSSVQAGQQASLNSSSGSAWIFKTSDGQVLDCYVANQQSRQTFSITGNAAPVSTVPVISYPPVVINPNPETDPINPPVNPPSNISRADMIPVQYLGVGFDAVYLDPENLTKNSVQTGSLAPPEIFEYTPDAQNYITLKKSDNLEVTKNLPRGVRGREIGNFAWSSNARWVKTASHFQKSFEHAYSGNVGVPGIASLSLSASFKEVNATTKSKESIYVYKDGKYQGHTLTMNMDHPHQLSAKFKSAVQQLGSSLAQYDQFIRQWGTHFSTENYIGGKCSYRFKLSKSSFSNRNESQQEFEQGVSGSLKQIEFGFGASQSNQRVNEVKNDVGSEEMTFISYGGSGQREFGQWAYDAQHNRTLIDLRLASYLELFNPFWFPNDTQISTKKQRLQQALIRYFAKHGHQEVNSSEDFFQKKPRAYTIKVTKLFVQKGKNTEDRHYGGTLYLGLYSQLKREIQSTLFMNLNGDSWLDWGQWKGNYIKLKEGQSKSYSTSFTKILQPNEYGGAYVTITGPMAHTWHWGTDAGKDSMGSRTERSYDGLIQLNEIEKGQTVQEEVSYTNTKEGDIVNIYFEVTRTK